MELGFALTTLCVSFTIFLLLGVPVAFAIALSCILTYLVEGLPLATAFQSMISGMNVFSFLAIPFFIFSGELMLHGGIADKIVTFARNLVGHWRAAWAWPTSSPARCLAASPARRSRTSRRWAG